MQRPQQKASIGGKEMTAMLTILVAVHSFLNYPRIVSLSAYEAAWMEPVLSGVISLVVVLILDALFRRYFSNMGLVEVFRDRFGPVVTGALSVVIALYFLVITATIMREFSENVITTVLPNTPIYIVGGLFVCAVVYVAFCGLEAIARVSFLALPVFIVGIFALCLFTINQWKPALLLPFWGSGVPNIVWGTLDNTTIFSNIIVLCMIRIHTHDPKEFRTIGIKSTLYATFILALFLVVYHMVFMPQEANKLTSPMYSLARIIHIGRFFQRLESIFIFMWVSAAVAKMAITLWCAAYALSVGFNWPVLRPILPALGLLCFAGSLLPKDMAFVLDYLDVIVWKWTWLIEFALPIVGLWLAALLPRKGRVV